MYNEMAETSHANRHVAPLSAQVVRRCPMDAKRFAWKRGIPIVMAALFLSSCAGSSTYMKPASSALAPTPDKALVRFMRPSGMGFAIDFNLFDGARLIGNIVAKSQLDYLADPGRHVFMATAENKVFLEADLAPGKLYYVITRIYPGAWRARVAFIAVTRGSEFWDAVLQYEKELQKLEPDEAKLRTWEEQNKDQIQALLVAYETEFKQKYDWPKLAAGDGR
jgi:hypothetical protein